MAETAEAEVPGGAPEAAAADEPNAADARPADLRRRMLARRPRWLRRIVLLAAAVCLLPLVLTVVYAVLPPISTLMLWRFVTLQPVTRDWTAFDDIAPIAVRAVVVSEDARLCLHDGIDTVEFEKVVTAYLEGEETRGASTIPMQVAKNLFLWPGRDPVRKAVELPLAVWLDFVLSKRRIVEIYLNIAEWGPDGEFGIAAAAARAFKTTPAKLGRRQAGLLAAVLPNPIDRDPAKPSRYVARRAAAVAAAAERTGGVLDCLFPDS